MNEDIKAKLLVAVEKAANSYRSAFANVPFNRKVVTNGLVSAYSEIEEYFTMKEFVVVVYNYLQREQKMFFGFDDREGALKIIPEELLM